MVDVSSSLSDAVFRLGFQNLGDSQASEAWVSSAELYQFVDDALKHLSYQAGIFVGLDTSVAVAAGTAVYVLPASHVFTIFAWVAPQAGVGGSNQALRATPVGSLFALDETWATTTGEARRYSLDAGSVGTVTVYPIPLNSGTLNQICQEFPGTVSAGAPQVATLPSVLQDYLTYAMLAGARGKESDYALPEMAAHFRERMELYERIIEHLWGQGQ
jgi:hypothetical protein